MDKSRPPSSLAVLGLALAMLATTGCHHEEQVAQVKLQKAEIKQLEEEYGRLGAKVKPYTLDRSKELAADKVELELRRREFERLGQELATLEKRKSEQDQSATAYRTAHPLKTH